MENNFEHIPVITQPKELKVNLYRHQLASVYEMEKRETDKFVTYGDMHIETTIGVNADKTGYGKCHGVNTPVIMYNGTIKMVQNIREGDLLMGDDSSPREVLSIARGRERMYKIKQNIGDDYVVNESHILSLIMTYPKRIAKHKERIQALYFDKEKIMFRSKTFNFKKYDDPQDAANNYLNSLGKIDTRIDICLKDYIKLPKKMQRQLKGYKSSVNCWENLLSPSDLDPYFIGLWLGDGESPEIATTDREILSYLKETFTESPEINKVRGICLLLKKYNLLNNKHIPHIYKINTRKNRLKVLAGLIDKDGNYQKGVYKINTRKNNTLAHDIKFLCGSLGFQCDIKKDNRITISGGDICEIPVLLLRKRATAVPNKNQLYTKISIENLNYDNYYGFKLNGNHRYLLGDFTVTHNTLSMATLIFRDKMTWDTNTMYNFSNTLSLVGGCIKKTTTVTYEKIDTTLVLVSQSIIHQWYDEIIKTPLAVTMLTSRKSIETTVIENYDVVLVTPTMYNRLVSKYSRVAWKRFIFDEPGHIKVPSMRKIVTGFIWLITATPDTIVTKHRKCRDSFMFDIVGSVGWQTFSQYYNYLIIKNDDAFIQFSFSMPPTEHYYHKCYNPVYKAVRGFVTSRITEMISAGNISGAINALGGGKTQNIVELIKQKKDEEVEELMSRIKILSIRNKRKQVKKLEEKVRRLQAQIEELGQRYKEILSGSCNICMETITDPVMEPGCQNIFCGKCLLIWLENKNSCPLCRKNVDKSKLIYIGKQTENNIPIHEEKKPLTKIDTIIHLLEKNPDKQFIVFSSWDQTFLPIRDVMTNNGIDFIEIKGDVNTRKKNIDKYKSGQIKVIFLNSKFNGTGINLQETDSIIVYHKMDNLTLNQIIGRANRLGRIDPLKVHHLQI